MTNPAPTMKGTWGLKISASLPAKKGATAPPKKRRKLYAADAVDRSTGAVILFLLQFIQGI
jgi:hypothetical protein